MQIERIRLKIIKFQGSRTIHGQPVEHTMTVDGIMEAENQPRNEPRLDYRVYHDHDSHCD